MSAALALCLAVATMVYGITSPHRDWPPIRAAGALAAAVAGIALVALAARAGSI